MTKVTKENFSEKVVDKWLLKCVAGAGALCYKMHPITNGGIPDRLVISHGRVFFVETKTTGKKCTPIQIAFHKKLSDAGIDTFVLDTKIESLYDIHIKAYKTYDPTFNKKSKENESN